MAEPFYFAIQMDMFHAILDLGGTFVFALSGGMAGVKHRLDIFGVLVLSFAAANAGGIARDVMIGATPVAALSDWRYVAVSLVAEAPRLDHLLHINLLSRRQMLRDTTDNFLHIARYATEIAQFSVGVDVHHRLVLIMRDLDWRICAGGFRYIAKDLIVCSGGRCDRCAVEGVEIVQTRLRYLDDDRIFDSCLRVHPKIGRYLAAAGERQKHIVHNIFRGQRKILRFPVGPGATPTAFEPSRSSKAGLSIGFRCR